MFGFVEWDSPLLLVMELALSVAVVVGIMFVARSRRPRKDAEDDD